MSSYHLTFIHSGGFIGIYRQIDVESATRRILLRESHSSPPRAATLTVTEVALITAALRDADIPRIDGPYRCVGCADHFIYDLTLRTGTAVHKVHWEDDSGAPSTLFRLGKLLTVIASRHFPAHPEA